VQIGVGKTTNEMANGGRYEYLVHPDDLGKEVWRQRSVNPFDAGWVGNCAGFWRGDVDWGSVGEVEGVMARGCVNHVKGDVGEFV
jgi:hypothetical protein